MCLKTNFMEIDLEITNEKGLHARASAKFVEAVDSFDATCVVTKDGLDVSGDSIMGLMMLAAAKGCFIHVKTAGTQAGALCDALTNLVNDKFGEGC